MKNAWLLLVSAFLLPGCSKPSGDTPPNDGNAHNVSTNNLPFAVTVVESETFKQWGEISKVALVYFEKQDYDELEKLAADGRTGDDAWPSGDWRVGPVYNGLELFAADSDKVWQAREAAIRAWVQGRPESITAQVALAVHLEGYAWKARGTGYANTVSDEAARAFEERLNEVAAVLEAAKNAKTNCPVYWTARFRLARGLGATRDQFNQICQEAMQAYPDYAPAYIQRATYLLPRWYGEEGEWEADLAKSADKIGGLRGDILYARVAWAMSGFTRQGNIFDDTPKLSWERVDRGWDAIEKEFPDSLDAAEIHLHMAGLAGDREKARKCLMKTGGKVTMSAWAAKGEFIECANFAL